MISKIIHYCWFGGNPLPKSAIKCINSWKKFFPDYEIKEWNESNFDVNMMPYTKEAYENKKYAFVSDVARFVVLYNEGGLYFDTDVEVIKSFDDIVQKGAFMGVETPAVEGVRCPTVAAGLGLGCEKGHTFFKECVDYYKSKRFLSSDGTSDFTTIVEHITSLLKTKGLKPTNQIQTLDSITIYPKEYFCPFDNNTGVMNKTKNTHSIHWYSMSWIDNYNPIRFFLTRLVHRFCGNNSLWWLKK